MTDRIGRAALAQTIRELEGIDNETRTALLELVNHRKKYGLVWEEHPEEVEERLREQLPVLEEDRALALTDGGKEAPNHVLIEGDNLEALTALTYTHEGKIDVIYIDPPYNTGNKDFSYNDSYVDSEDGYRHSKWLSFMSKRLRIAKRLLSDKGVIFISIDDNEQANLKLLCDEVFGGRNFIAQVIWERAFAPVNLKKHFSESHDYIVCYAKCIDNAKCNGLPRTYDANNRYSNPDNDTRGAWTSSDMTVGPRIEEKCYEITTPNGTKLLPVNGRCWLFTENRYNEMLADNRIWFGEDGGHMPRVKKFITEVKQGITPMTIWKHSEVGHSQDATKEVKDIFGGESRFTYPKSMRLIKRIVGLYGDKKSIVLDFFAGSGTTMHATMQLNKEDGGHRQCILVTNNENNICREVTYERNKRVIQGYITPKGAEVEGLGQNNLRYYRTKLLPRDTGLTAQRRLMEAATELLCIKHDIYEERTMLGGLTLKPRLARYFAEEGRAGMLIVYRTEAIGRLVEEIKTLPEGGELLVYVFSLSSYAMDADFEEVADRVTLCALPRAIYNAYQKVLPKKGRRQELPPLATSDENTQLTIEEGGEA